MLKPLARRISRLMPPKAHLLLVQPFSQTRKVANTLQYHAQLYRLRRKEFAGLHVGSGGLTIEGFCNLDANPYSRCDVVAGLKRLKLHEASVAVIYASHVFEHVPRAEVGAVLREWHRVLKPGGRLYLCVPDFEVLCRMYLDNLPRYDTEEGRYAADYACSVIFGGQVDEYDFHFNGYSFATLGALLRDSGFREVARFDDAGLLPRGAVDASTAAIGGVPISLNLTAVK